MLDPQQTICAVASPAGGALRGVIRISGSRTLELLDSVIIGAPQWRVPPFPHRTVGRIDTQTALGQIEIAVLVWATSRSYTGEPAAELHLIGAEPILQGVLERLLRCGARVAAPGEFTMRAFLAGRIDLTQAEAVLGVIDADTRRGLTVALDQLTGGISAPLQTARRELLELLADVEAGLDFVDEDIQFVDDEELARRLGESSDQIRRAADQLSSRGRAGDCPLAALCGWPNAGKSRLMNALTGLESSIVSELVGTTRDPVEARLRFEFGSLRIVDTAGIEAAGIESADTAAGGAAGAAITDQAQRLGESIVQSADVRLWCQDATQIEEGGDEHPASLAMGTLLRVATKVDLVDPGVAERLRSRGWILTSAAEGRGLRELLDAVRAASEGDASAAGVAATASRCRETLTDAAAGLAAAAQVTAAGGGHELVAAELRLALDAIGRVTGEVYTEEILDSIFSRFCIGK